MTHREPEHHEIIVPPDAEYITYRQAAHLLQVSVSTVKAWVRAGRLRRYGEDHTIRVRRAEVIAFFEHMAGVPEQTAEQRAAAILARHRHG
jgi:excisionase family DNA binding protein